MPKPNVESGVYDEFELHSSANEAHAIHTLEQVNDIKNEIKTLEKEEVHSVEVEEIVPDPLSPFRAAADNGAYDDRPTPNTVQEILKLSSLVAFKPEKDTETQCLQRIRNMCPLIRRFVQKVRVHEGVLSKAVINGEVTGKVGKYHQYEHLLAKLRRKYSLQGVRQSRFAAWAFFSKEVSKKACEDMKSKDVAEGINKFTPSCFEVDGKRSYQLIAVRLHVVGKPMLALVEEVFRGSLNKKGRRTGKKLCEHVLDAHLTASVRAVLLRPQSGPDPEVAKEDRAWLFSCSCRSPAVILQVHDEECPILWVVPPSQYEVEETSIQLRFKVRVDAVDALSTAHGKGVVPGIPKGSKEDPDCSTRVSYTPEAFRSRKNIIQYVDIMRSMLYKTLSLHDINQNIPYIYIYLQFVKNCLIWVVFVGGGGMSFGTNAHTFLYAIHTLEKIGVLCMTRLGCDSYI